jgi:hypothetical protein
MKLINKKTGQIIDIPNGYSRLNRCRKRVKMWAEMLKPFIEEKRLYRLVMVTLTYKPGREWASNDIRVFMIRARRVLKSNLLGYAWVAELQKRGAVHYHVLLLVRKGTNIPVPDKCGWWPWGMSRIETAKTPYYVLTYTGKRHQKIGNFPEGLRLFAVWLSEEAVGKLRYWSFRFTAVPGWFEMVLNSLGAVGGGYRRNSGGGWFYADRIYYSNWQVISIYD